MLAKKYIRYIVTFLLCISFTTCSIPAMASTQTPSVSIIELEDGNYVEISTTILPVSSRSSNMTAAERTFTYISFSGDKLFSYTLYGEFEYNGTTSKATYVDYVIGIYNSSWELDNHSEYISGNSVRGSAKFNGPLFRTETLSGGITCDKNGNIL